MKYLLFFILFTSHIAISQVAHRNHVLGMVFTTYPPIYSCALCGKEVSPYDLLPKVYAYDMFGYRSFCDSLKELHLNEDSFFIAKWNEIDTSCISFELAARHSKDVWKNWLGSHKKGEYWIDKNSAMSTDGFITQYDGKGNSTMAYGGRYSDSILLADKWYKVKLDK